VEGARQDDEGHHRQAHGPMRALNEKAHAEPRKRLAVTVARRYGPWIWHLILSLSLDNYIEPVEAGW